MMAALLQHTWLVLTFRHDGRGLPRSTMVPFLLIVAACCAVSWLRWETTAAFVGMWVQLVVVGMFSLRFAAGMALASIGVDIVCMVLGVPDAWGMAWELLAYAALAWRMARA